MQWLRGFQIYEFDIVPAYFGLPLNAIMIGELEAM